MHGLNDAVDVNAMSVCPTASFESVLHQRVPDARLVKESGVALCDAVEHAASNYPEASLKIVAPTAATKLRAQWNHGQVPSKPVSNPYQ
jgi:hypothetical protein